MKFDMLVLKKTRTNYLLFYKNVTLLGLNQKINPDYGKIE